MTQFDLFGVEVISPRAASSDRVNRDVDQILRSAGLPERPAVWRRMLARDPDTRVLLSVPSFWTRVGLEQLNSIRQGVHTLCSDGTYRTYPGAPMHGAPYRLVFLTAEQMKSIFALHPLTIHWEGPKVPHFQLSKPGEPFISSLPTLPSEEDWK
ncbi:hypothetical protein [Granulibacter bethesdensis]|uniref:hypothetical protein n=1 Tax=Granulibacter bethesdensis TaxID=364410 RepID=UPI0003F1D37B|nr:hypothetical protein [Granulibacter bethesdensis]AHJ66331.1 Hypothetical protein GbCGDNIH4_7204 [Granulibacter bethesdensis CGDNIH4]